MLKVAMGRVIRQAADDDWPDGRILNAVEDLVDAAIGYSESSQSLISQTGSDNLFLADRPHFCAPTAESGCVRAQRHQRWAGEALLLLGRAESEEWPISRFLSEAKHIISQLRSELEHAYVDWFSLPSKDVAPLPHSQSEKGYRPFDNCPLKHDPPHRT